MIPKYSEIFQSAIAICSLFTYQLIVFYLPTNPKPAQVLDKTPSISNNGRLSVQTLLGSG